MAKVAAAKRHAQAVFQLALEKNEVETWRSDLRALSRTLSEPELIAILESPKVHLQDKLELVRKLNPDLGQLALNLAFLLVARQRLSLLNEILADYERMADAHRGLEHARVTTAVPLEKEDRERLSERLGLLAGKRVLLSSEIDPGIIGGFVARIGDKLIDGSTRAKLEALKRKLVETA